MNSELEKQGGKGMPARREPGWRAKLALIFIPSLLVFGGLEGAARLYAARVYGTQNHGMNWKFKYEPYLQTRTDDRLYAKHGDKGDAFRVVVIGGSTAALMPDDVLAAALEPTIGKKVEVINLGQGGYIANQERIMLLLHGMPLKPDLILTLDGANDLVTATKTQRPGITYADDFIALGVNRPVLSALLGLVRDSQFINSINKLRERSVERKAHGDDSLLEATLAHFDEAVGSMSTIARGMGVPHVMVLQPYITLRKNPPPDEAANAAAYLYRQEFVGNGMKTIRERLSAQTKPGVLFIDATCAFDEVQSVVFMDEVHLKGDGNKVLAAHIAKAIREKGLPTVTLTSASR